jgi:hypothetical protein
MAPSVTTDVPSSYRSNELDIEIFLVNILECTQSIVQSFIDRRFYRSKYDARRTLETFSTTLRDETDLDALSGTLVGVVRETMQPAYASLWLRPGSAPRQSEGSD